MASNRIVIDRTKPLGQNVANAIATLARAREMISELALILGGNGYNQDVSLQTDLGISAADQTRLQNLVTQANNELNATATTLINVGSATGTRQLCDALSLTI
jgi:hypothetical protein